VGRVTILERPNDSALGDEDGSHRPAVAHFKLFAGDLQ
jgi:hypothetical protein